MKNKKIMNRKSEILFLILLITITIILRFYGIHRPDFFFDEAVQAISAKNFLVTGDLSDIYQFGHPPLFQLLLYAPALLFGVSEYSLRTAEALFGTLAVFIVYFLTKMWYGKRYALISSFLMAVMPLPVIYSRLIYGYGVSMFFTVSSIFAVEFLIRHKLKKRHELLMIFVSGILISLTMLIRYNSIVIFGLYWTFVLSYAYFKEKKRFKRYVYYAIASNIVALILFITTILFLGGISRLIYVVQNFLFVIQSQSTQSINPFYYHIILLFDGISPILFLILPFALVYPLINKKRTRPDVLISVLVILFLLIITVQARKFSRHQLVIYPLIIILASRFLIDITSKFSKKIKSVILIIIVIGTFSWTLFLINNSFNFDVWSQVGNYLDEDIGKSVAIHTGYARNRQLKIHTDRFVDSSVNLSLLNKDDLVVFAFLNDDTTIPENSPFEDTTTLYKSKSAATRGRNLEYPKDYYRYVNDHGKLIKKFSYKGGTAVWIYEITDTKDKKLYENLAYEGIIGKPTTYTNLFGLWNIVCNNFKKGNLIDKMMNMVISNQQKKEIKIRCH